jgi:hypothetical protein
MHENHIEVALKLMIQFLEYIVVHSYYLISLDFEVFFLIVFLESKYKI